MLKRLGFVALLAATACAVPLVERTAAPTPAGTSSAALASSVQALRVVAPPATQSANQPATPPGVAKLPRPKIGDDFYTHVNNDWLSTYELPADKASHGATEEMTERAEEDVHTMIEELIASKPAKGTVGQKIADLYAAAMDEAGIEARGVEPLQPFLKRIRAVQTREELLRLMGVIGYASPVSASVGPTPADPDSNAVWVSQAGLGMPHRGYYMNYTADSAATQGAYRKYVATILRLIGNPDPEAAARRIYNLEYRIALAHTDDDRSIAAEETMRPMTFEQLKAFAPAFDWNNFLGEAGLTGSDRFVVTDHTAVTNLGKLVGQLPVDDWKLYMEFHIASDFSPYLPKAFFDAAFDFYTRQLSGVTEQPERWRFAVAVVNERMGDAVSQLYVQRYFPPENKARIDAIVTNIRAAFDARIRKLDWMDEPTRKEALTKLSQLQGMIGYPDTWRDFSTYTVEPGKLVEAVYAGYEFDWRQHQVDLHAPVDRKRWPTPAHVVNAFYNPLGNVFVLPAGILQPPFFDPAADPAENYGGIGAVIGHEMSHGFDDQGRQFDGLGRTRNWWTPETDDRFVEKSDDLIRQYGAYCPYYGACVNGLGTLGENIGDLSGVEIAYAAYRLSLGGKEAPVIDGLTGDQRFFIAYARSYRDKVREELARALLEGDGHAPSRYRVNGVVRNMDAWYAAFDIKPTDRLYLPPNQRVRLW